MRRSIALFVLAAALVALGVWAIPQLVIRPNIISLQLNPLTTAVADKLSNNGKGLVPGKDFNLQTIYYFDDNSWAVARITPVNNNLQASLVVAKKVAGGYQIVLGPGTLFRQSDLQKLPKDVAAYLYSIGAIIT